MSSDQRTVKIRIAVCINERGEWVAYGSINQPPEDVMASASQMGWEGEIEARYWVEADVEIPVVGQAICGTATYQDTEEL